MIQVRDDEIIPNIYLINHSQSDFQAEMNGKAGIAPTEIKVKLLHSQIQTFEGTGFRVYGMAQGRDLALALGKSPQYSRQKYMPLRPAQ